VQPVKSAGYVMRNLVVAGIASASLLTVVSSSADDPGELLRSMKGAGEEISYQGDFVYERAGSFSTHRVWRQVNGDVVERLLRTDGASQEWLRRNHTLVCTSSAAGAATWFDSALLSDKSVSLEQWYELEILGTSRVANRSATVLSVRPRDDFRYAYELYFDVDSGLLLQSLMINDEGALLERFQFTNLQVGPVAPADLDAANSCMPARKGSSSALPADHRWLPAWLPPGFTSIGSDARQSNGNDVTRSTQVFSDGLARFTIFVEPLTENRVADDLLAQLGPTVAVSRGLNTSEGNFMATVVGEIPPMTAKRVAASLPLNFDADAHIEALP
jgi:sigma-E factor negative regulatory protein RseB